MTKVSAIADRISGLRQVYTAGRTKSLAWRESQLRALIAMLKDEEERFTDALTADLGRDQTEGWLADLAPVKVEAQYALKHLRSWAKPVSVPVPATLRPGRAWYEFEPRGVALIIGPWNYPIFLTLAPLVGALAAGNAVVIKPSEMTPATSAVLAEVLPRYLDDSAVIVVEGGAEETQALLEQGLDYCFFTGSPAVGRAVMQTAARHLTPVTLELGGKCPVIVAADANVAVAARRVAAAKLLNSGQTCVAPDYVLVDEGVRDEFVRQLCASFDAFTADGGLPIINTAHHERLSGLIESAGGHLARGGRASSDERFQATVIVDPDPDAPVMYDEIFGPILPVITIRSLDDAIASVNARPPALAVYAFTESRSTERSILDRIHNGATTINAPMYHLAVPELPFGGVGESGMGSYHGKWGYETFSHRKAVLRRPTWPDPSIAYPPYVGIKRRILRALY